MLELFGLYVALFASYVILRIFAIPLLVSIVLFFILRKRTTLKRNILISFITYVFLVIVSFFAFPLSDFNVYKETNPPTLANCESKQVQKGFCMQEYAVKNNDMSVCYKINDDNKFREDCFDAFRKKADDVSFCKKFNDTVYEDALYKANCYSHFAFEKRDVSLCQMISSSNFSGFQRQTIESTKTVCLQNIK